MKKLVSVMVIAMVLALAFTVATNAEAWTPQTDGLYDFTFDLDADKTGTMYGMVVIEAADDAAAFELSEDNIRYIDQVTANGNTLSFTDVGPMELQDGGKYYVYIGGEGILGEDGLPGAKRIGTLSAAGTTPEPPATPTFTVTFVADGVTVDTITKNVGETVLTTEFPEVPAKTGFTGKWNVTTDITETATVTAEYTEIPVETFTVTFIADGETVEAITKNVGETLLTTQFPAVPEKTGFTGKWNVTTDITSTTTVTAEYTAVGGSEPDAVLGDINGDTNVDILDATYLFNYSLRPTRYPIDAYPGHVDFYKDGNIDIQDATYLFNYSLRPTRYPISWE